MRFDERFYRVKMSGVYTGRRKLGNQIIAGIKASLCTQASDHPINNLWTDFILWQAI